MSHLPTERLAALVDETPTPAELAHFAGCAECMRERAVYRALADMAAAETARIGTPLTSWEKLAPALRGDGIIDDGSNRRLVANHAVRQSRAPWMQIAAAVVVAAGGVMAGRYSAGASMVPALATTLARTAPAQSVPDSQHFKSVEDAKAAQAQSYALYQTATDYLAERDTSRLVADSPAAMRARLVALDRASAAMGKALAEAPYDPVINGYYLTTQSQREATIRQLNTVMPASMKIQSY